MSRTAIESCPTESLLISAVWALGLVCPDALDAEWKSLLEIEGRIWFDGDDARALLECGRSLGGPMELEAIEGFLVSQAHPASRFSGKAARFAGLYVRLERDDPGIVGQLIRPDAREPLRLGGGGGRETT